MAKISIIEAIQQLNRRLKKIEEKVSSSKRKLKEDDQFPLAGDLMNFYEEILIDDLVKYFNNNLIGDSDSGFDVTSIDSKHNTIYISCADGSELAIDIGLRLLK